MIASLREHQQNHGAPSLRRNYPVSSVLRASPSPHTARPVSRELPVDRSLRSLLGLPVLRLFPIACMPSPLPRQDQWKLIRRASPPISAFPEMSAGRLLHCTFRGLLSVHSRYSLHARQVAKSDPLHQRLQQLRCLRYCSDCFWVERTSFRVGLSPTVDQRFHGARHIMC